MKIMIKIAIRMFLAVLLLAAGFAAGYPMGHHSGFSTGTEWALMQAQILAREAGVFMPVSLDEQEFRVVLKQPRHLYRNAWRLADSFEVGTQTGDVTEEEKICSEDLDLQKEDILATKSAELLTAVSITSGPGQLLQAEQRVVKTF